MWINVKIQAAKSDFVACVYDFRADSFTLDNQLGDLALGKANFSFFLHLLIACAFLSRGGIL